MQAEPSPAEPLDFGRYKLLRRIGAGGMGEVFLAREDGSPPRACVVKKVLPQLLQNQAFVGRFRDESKVVVRLRHGNVARVYAMGEVEGELFLAMEYVQGKTVSRFTRRLRELKKVLPVGCILLIGERICEGLAYAHDATDEHGQPLHLVHRDLSPANVCISYRGEVKIIDFGAAQSTLKLQQTAPRVVIGNLTYMAPEQARKQIVDRRADVYSVGALLWELLAWQLLPQRGDPLERWRRAANPSWGPPSQYRPGLSPEVDRIVLRALSKDPADRFPDARALGHELHALRERQAPEANERMLGRLLSEAFAAEKHAEDAALEEALRFDTLTDVPTATDFPTEILRRPLFVPPTALAFEHAALQAPVDYVPPDEEVTEPAVPRSITVDMVNPTRVGFGVTFPDYTEPSIASSIIEEIEAIASLEPVQEPAPRAAPSPVPKSSRKETKVSWGLWLWVGGAVFLLAVGLGFVGTWLWSLLR